MYTKEEDEKKKKYTLYRKKKFVEKLEQALK